MKNKLFFCIVILLSLFIFSCYYTFENKRLEGIETVYIMPVENNTIKYEIGDLLTKGLNDNFMSTGSLKIANKEEADAVIFVKVRDYDKETGSIDNEGNMTSVRMVFYIDFSLSKGEETIESEDNYRFEKIFEYNQSLTETILLSNAVESLADEITEQIVEGF